MSSTSLVGESTEVSKPVYSSVCEYAFFQKKKPYRVEGCYNIDPVDERKLRCMVFRDGPPRAHERSCLSGARDMGSPESHKTENRVGKTQLKVSQLWLVTAAYPSAMAQNL